MKKTLLFAISMMAVVSANAQFEINDIGKIFIGTGTTTSAQMNIRAQRTNILANRVGTANGIAPALEGINSISSPQWAMGVRGASSGYNGAINCGLWGSASTTTSNKIYGVFGSIDSNRGAAIYGQAYAWTSSSGAALT